MAVPGHDERFRRWRERRSAWLQAKAPWVHEYPYPDTDVSTVAAAYVRDEILVSEEHHAEGLNIVSGLGHRRSAIETRDVAPGFRMLKTSGLDAWTATRRLRDNVGHTPGAVVSLNHVYMSSPWDMGGPHGDPSPGQPVTLHAPAASGVKVAVLDTGVWSESPLPAGSYAAGPGDYETEIDVNADGVIDSDVGHANFIAGVVLSRTANARVRIVKLLTTLGLCTDVELANTLLSLDDVDIVNLSLGGFTADDQPAPVVQMALETVLANKDRVVVAAAGNDGQSGRPFWPAAFSSAGQAWSDQVLAVAAHDGNGVCAWSNTGPWVTLTAPGQDVASTYIVHSPAFATGWATWSGTSFAAPYVAAAIADQLASCGTVTAAADQVRKNASQQTYGTFPGLP
jgi:thermitase